MNRKGFGGVGQDVPVPSDNLAEIVEGWMEGHDQDVREVLVRGIALFVIVRRGGRGFALLAGLEEAFHYKFHWVPPTLEVGYFF